MKNDLLEAGARRLEWARSHMGVLGEVKKELQAGKGLAGKKIGMAVHLEAKTGILALTLRDCGAKVSLTSCNPLTTDDCVAVALKEEEGLSVYAKRGQTNEEYYKALNKVLDLKPDVVIDDGADLISILHTERKSLLDGIMGASEETTTGVHRLKIMASDSLLKFPVISVNDANMKYLFDNRYGTGQSTMDGILSATNLLIAGKNFIVAGYGWCGRGIAMRAKGMGARVTVTEIDPVRAIEAKLDGFDVRSMKEAVRNADFVVTATGNADIITKEHLEVIKDGCVLANSGHFDVEISKPDLEAMSSSKRKAREHVDEYVLKNGKKVYLLGEGRLINLVAGQGHPVEIMDLSFSLQALCADYLVRKHEDLKNEVYDVPKEIDGKVAMLKLKLLGAELDQLNEKQRKYTESWSVGT
jgi:adenosylhomocysteinase